jgi:hypothetical protein
VMSITCALNYCSALFCLLFLLLPYPLTDVLSPRVLKLFHMIHMLLLTRIVEMFFFLVSEKHMYILSSGQKPKEKYFDQTQTCSDRPKQIWGIH